MPRSGTTGAVDARPEDTVAGGRGSRQGYPACDGSLGWPGRVRRDWEMTVARSMWRGAIQFGLVTIPVRLYLATESRGISFNMLHKTDLSRIQMKVWCPVEDE